MTSSAASPDIDESRWPVVVITMPSRTMTDLELEAVLDQQREICNRGLPCVFIMDVRIAPELPSSQRRMVAERLDEYAEKYPSVMLGVGVVLRTAVQRGIVGVLSWLMKKPFHMETFASVELAVPWALRLTPKPRKMAK